MKTFSILALVFVAVCVVGCGPTKQEDEGLGSEEIGENIRAEEARTRAEEARTRAEHEVDRGTKFLLNGDNDTAIICFTEAIRLSPDYAYAYTLRGQAYKKKGYDEWCGDDWKRAKELEAEQAQADRKRANELKAKQNK